MTSKSIVIILAPPGNAGTRLTSALNTIFHGDTPPSDVLLPVSQQVIDQLEMDPLAPFSVGKKALTDEALRENRLQARRIALALRERDLPVIHHHPSTSLVIPFWRDAFDSDDFKLKMILIGTNALESREYLLGSTDLKAPTAMMVWAQSMLHGLNNSSKNVILTQNNRLLAKPEDTLLDLVNSLGLQAPDDLDARLSKAAQRIKDGDQSERAYTRRDVSRDNTLPRFIKELDHFSSNNFQNDTLSDKARNLLTPLFETYDEFGFFLSGAQAVSQSNHSLLARIEEANSVAARLDEANKSLEEKLESATKHNTALSEQNSSLEQDAKSLRDDNDKARLNNNEAIGILTEKNEALQASIHENEKTVTALQQLLEKQRKATSEKLHTLEIEAAQLKERHDAAERLITEMRQIRIDDRHRSNLERATLLKQLREAQDSLEDAKNQPAAPANGVIDEEQSKALIRDAVDQARMQMRLDHEQTTRSLEERARQAEQRVLDQDADLAQFRMDAEVAREEIRAIKQSTSWKISAPIRGAKSVITKPTKTAKAGLRGTARVIKRAIPSRGQHARNGLLGSGLNTPAKPNFQGAALNQPNGANDLGDLDDPINETSGVAINPNRTNIDVSGLDGYVARQSLKPVDETKARAIAFYLPQFHQIPENDAWWGEGFTEWTNVRPAKPQFPNHYQPREPGELGWYDLVNDKDIFHRQVDLAKSHGISGFAFYHYWFGGKRLLEKPVDRWLADKSIDFPYCLCWANESWSRRWDGREQEILMPQSHSQEDDLKFIENLRPHLQDPRYIKIDGKPVILVYRPGILPNARDTADRWREWCAKNGVGDIYLAYTQSFETVDPANFGFDAAIEFPPNNHGLVGRPGLIGADPGSFKGKVFDWQDLVRRSEHYPPTSFKLFRGVNPSWDNTARRGETGTVLLNAKPSEYARWLNNAVDDTSNRFSNHDERLIFINAWNEWAEGAHLEPDQRHGYAWLEATRRALAPPAAKQQFTASIPVSNPAAEKKILIVTHDLFRHGAQFLSLNFARSLKNKFGFTVQLIAGEDGPLRSHGEAICPLSVLTKDMPAEQITKTLRDFKAKGFSYAFLNSSASGWLAPYFHEAGIRFVGLVHEMASIAKTMNLQNNLAAFESYADRVIFPATIVRDQTAQFLPEGKWTNPSIIPQGIYKSEGLTKWDEKADARKLVTSQLSLPASTRIILGTGYADHRKGIDIFLEWAIETLKRRSDLAFVWLGEISIEMQERVDQLLKSAGPLAKHIHLPGFVHDTRNYYLAASLYALSSREDPFPSTALEALNAGTPVIMMEGTGGIEDLCAQEATPKSVCAIAQNNSQAFATLALSLLGDEDDLKKRGLAGVALMQERFGFTSYISDLLDIGARAIPAFTAPGVSVVVPNYNYERHLEKRLRSIIEQSVPPREVIFLDDASTDNSVALAREILTDCGIHHQIICNTKNSGNVFAQWQKGVDLARYPVCWIAEADDWADRDFLQTLAPKFLNPKITLCFSQSRQIDETGSIIAANYDDYVRDIDDKKWTQDFEGLGPSEVISGFSVKNTIPNVSGALIRTRNIQSLLATDIAFARRFRTAGDWYVYVNLLREGKLAFCAQALNYHRRHSNSVTISKFDIDDLSEIANMQRYIAREFKLGPAEHEKAKTYLSYLIDHFDLRSRYDQATLETATTMP